MPEDQTEDLPTTFGDSVVQIDELALDKECIRLPGDYLKFAKYSAEMKNRVDELSAELKVARADMSKTVREKPEDYGLDKVTETGLASVIETLPRIINAQKRLRKAEHRYQMAQAVVWALEHKKRSLTMLVDLHGMGYFAEVKPSAKGKESIEKMATRRIRSSSRDEE